MIHFELVTLSGTKFGQEAYEVLVPTPEGIIAIFKNHAPLVSIVNHGVISVRHKANEPDDLMAHFAVSGGAVEVGKDKVRVLVDEADRPEEINEQEAAKALERAKQLLKEAKDPVSLEHAQSLISLQSTRLKVASLRRNRKSRY